MATFSPTHAIHSVASQQQTITEHLLWIPWTTQKHRFSEWIIFWHTHTHTTNFRDHNKPANWLTIISNANMWRETVTTERWQNTTYGYGVLALDNWIFTVLVYVEGQSKPSTKIKKFKCIELGGPYSTKQENKRVRQVKASKLTVYFATHSQRSDHLVVLRLYQSSNFPLTKSARIRVRLVFFS